MKLRPMILDDAAKADIARVMAYAKANPLSLATIKKIMKHPENCPGDSAKHVCIVKFGYRCVYTYEEQPQPLGMCGHLSVSVLGDGVAPNEVAVEALMEEFGFRGGLMKCDMMYIEQIGQGKIAINVLQKSLDQNQN